MDFSVFSGEPAPSNMVIANSESIEGLGVTKFFSGRTVGEITLDRLKSGYPHDPSACLAFMTPQAFAFFLPAFMRIALEDHDRADVISEYLIWYLLEMAEDKNRERLDAILASYTRAQLRGVATFLREMSARYWRHYPTDDAQKALSLYWGEFEN